MKWFKRLGYLLLTGLLAATIYVVPTVWGTPWRINDFYFRVLLEALLDDPLLLTQLRMLESVGLTFHADDLPDQTMALRQKQAERAESQLAMLESWAREDLPEDERLSWDVMHWLLERGVESASKFIAHPYVVEQMQGLHVRFPDVMVNYHRIESASDAEDYIVRVSKVGAALDDLAATAAAQEKKGFTIPGFILEKVAKDARKFHDEGENPLAVDFEKKVAALEASDSAKDSLRASFDEALTKQALPGYARFVGAIEEMAARAPDDAGVWHLPDGDAYYDSCIRDGTSTTMSADEIHRIGLAEVERIQGEMKAILQAQGVPTSTASFGDIMRKVSEDPRWYYPDSDAGRAQILARYEQIIEDIEGKLDGMFQTDPKAPVNVEPVAKFKQETSPFAYYFPAAMDGSKPGTFFANLRDVKEHKKFGMRTLAYHEAIPGHHFQLSIARAQDHLPVIRQLIPLTAFSEGWALYAEQLAAENGFQDDPFDRIGYLDAQLFRALRLVVDTGLHAKKWSRDQAIEYMLANGGGERGEIEAEVERYCVWPGQALGYMVGRLRFLALRAKARAALGDEFDLRAFHDAVLLEGALPLELLERQVDRWIEATKGRRASEG